MTPFRDLPIRRKVAFVIILTNTIVLLLTSAAFMTYEWITFRHAALTNLTTLSRMIADNTTAALRFHDEADVRETLVTLRAEPDIVSATIYDERGSVIAFYSTRRTQPPPLADILESGHRFVDGHLVLRLPIVHDRRALGTLFIESSLTAMQRRFGLYGGIVFLILVASSFVAFALSSRLQKRITEPIRELARTAQEVTARGDFTVRASRYGNDELGALTDAFNRMLAETTEREQRLTASEERLRVALAAAEMGTWRYYPERHESIVDENLRRIYGLSPGSGTASEAEMLERIFPEDRAPVRAELSRALQSPEAQFAFEYRVLSLDGGLRWVRDRGRVVRRPDGAVDYVTGALVDLTERKVAEQEIQRLNSDLEHRVAERTAELEQANSELEAFTYSVSHDLRGPLRHISGYSEIVREDTGSQLSEDAKTSLGRIGHAANRLTKLVDSLLNLSRVGRKALALQQTRLDDIATLALREIEAETKNRRVEWQRQPLPVVNADPSLLHIVFVNLLSNALKYTRPRDVAVIALGTEVREGQTVVFVRDNGVGFDPRLKAKLFGVFERLHSAAEFEGTGVGLATVERILRKHGGRIWADAQVDQGATFYFTLPGM
jgi:PAS domain S-box-containing protein